MLSVLLIKLGKSRIFENMFQSYKIREVLYLVGIRYIIAEYLRKNKSVYLLETIIPYLGPFHMQR